MRWSRDRHEDGQRGLKTVVLSVLLVAAAMLAGCASRMRYAPERTELLSDRVTLPGRVCDRYFFVEGEIESERYTFVLDTGAGVSVVTREFAEAYPAWVRGVSGVIRGAEADAVEVRRAVRIPELRLGGARFSEFDAVVIDLTDISDALGVRLDGIIGYPLFRDVVLTLDYPGSEARVSREWLKAGAGTIRIGREAPTIKSVVNGEERVLLIDSGSSECVALFAKIESLPLTGSATAQFPSVTISGLQQGDVMGRLDGEIEVAGTRVRRPIISETSGSSRIGTRVLEHFVVSFDQRAGLARFERTGGDVEIESVRGTGAVFRLLVDEWIVWAVMPGTPAAEADLEFADTVTLVEGRDPGALLCGGWRELLRERDEVLLTVRRDGVEREVRVGVIDVVP